MTGKTFKGLDCTGCVALLRSGEWGILPLSNCTIQRPVACRALNDDSSWTFGGKGLNDPPCPSGYTLAAPTNGFANKHLKKASELYFLLHPFEHGVFLPIMPNGTKWST